ncbi:LOW QUALITY PROTEIN: hypothetical protein BC938DRAFT_474171 [Jimgerdemannia flammicorona]|uniref:Peptidase S54 rhomboid domain-containing protein n=1 Tax=Jimgerdemannia flammicorona TaxID=994334 RepID=A0A433QSQ6_9FUNG|nr:LOW QUALITY PROTEIN: hypothetical protein BC938DRAFT_474171 [Jimgerdemannia flammicorona]
MSILRLACRPFRRPLFNQPTFFNPNLTPNTPITRFSTANNAFFTTNKHMSTFLANTHPQPSLRSLFSNVPLIPASAPRALNRMALFRPTNLRTYIRPHYYNDPSSLSSAVRRNQNPIVRFARSLDNTNPNTVIWFIIGTNISVYLAWMYAIGSYQQFRDARWLLFMTKNFLVSNNNIEHGRLHTLLTSAFSHKDLPHLGINMFVLYSIGTAVCPTCRYPESCDKGAGCKSYTPFYLWYINTYHLAILHHTETVGATRFLVLYSVAGVAGGLAHLAYHRFIRPVLASNKGQAREQFPITGTLGASDPHARFLIFFVIPMPAYLMVGLFAAYDIYRASTLSPGRVDSASHIGGALYGLGYYFLRVRPLLRAGRWRV